MARPTLQDRIAARAAERAAANRTRRLRIVEKRDGVRYQVDGRWLLAFAGNDYLGLSQHFAVVSALQDAASREGVGGTASHLVCGHHAAHGALQHELAEWIGAPRALLFSSGYMANLAVIQSLLGEGDVCVQDRLNHASLIDAARLAGCHLRRYPHADAEGAVRQLRSAPEGVAVLATDGVFSMDGDIAPLKELSLVAHAQRAKLYVDDAHGIGVVGPEGRGSVAAANLRIGGTPLQLVTFGKALGTCGAAVLGEASVIEHLTQTARPYIYTTALPPGMAAATAAAIRLARREEWRRERLGELVERLRGMCQDRGFELLPSQTPIQPLLCRSDTQALGMSRALEAQGFWVPAIRPPSVPEGGARLRITLSALHTLSDVEALVNALERARVAAAREEVGLA